MISLGIESGDEELLAQHRQNADLKMLAEKIMMIKRAGIRTKGLLMMGLPGETEASIKKSMNYVFSLPIDDFNLAKFTPFPGSPVYERIHDLGIFEEDWEKMDCMHFVFEFAFVINKVFGGHGLAGKAHIHYGCRMSLGSC